MRFLRIRFRIRIPNTGNSKKIVEAKVGYRYPTEPNPATFIKKEQCSPAIHDSGQFQYSFLSTARVTRVGEKVCYPLPFPFTQTTQNLSLGLPSTSSSFHADEADFKLRLPPLPLPFTQMQQISSFSYVAYNLIKNLLSVVNPHSLYPKPATIHNFLLPVIVLAQGSLATKSSFLSQ